jgi:hypothetical protein
MKYKLNVKRDVDVTEDGNYILNLPNGFRFDEHSYPNDRHHVKGYDSLKEIRADIKFVIPCDCCTFSD